ncbi:MAG: helix-turn-helix domain-containing protein [Clostridiaceae bacterium]
MATFAERLKELRNEKGISLDKLAEILSTTKATLSRYENNLREPKHEFVQNCAELFDVSVDYMVGKSNNKVLNKKDEKDIEKLLNQTIEIIDNQEGLMLNGEVLDEEDLLLLKQAIKNGLEYAKISNKKKYTPNKYK